MANDRFKFNVILLLDIFLLLDYPPLFSVE